MPRSLLLLALALIACRSEPTFVITFAPQDGGASAKAAPTPVPDLKAPPAQPPTAAATGDPCAAASDCVAMTDGCCDCDHGGKLRAVARARKALVEKARDCRSTMCVAMLSGDASCGMVADCVEGRCALAAKKGK